MRTHTGGQLVRDRALLRRVLQSLQYSCDVALTHTGSFHTRELFFRVWLVKSEWSAMHRRERSLQSFGRRLMLACVWHVMHALL